MVERLGFINIERDVRGIHAGARIAVLLSIEQGTRQLEMRRHTATFSFSGGSRVRPVIGIVGRLMMIPTANKEDEDLSERWHVHTVSMYHRTAASHSLMIAQTYSDRITLTDPGVFIVV